MFESLWPWPMPNTNYANRGKSLETIIEYANEQYKAKGVALVQKVATPWTVIRRGKQIVSAFPAEKSTVDFIGVVSGGNPVAFDAKQCKSTTSFPLSNVEQHQLNFLRLWEFNGGTSFLLIEMAELRKIYRVEFHQLMIYWNQAANGGKKSIPIKNLKAFKEVGELGGIVLDYLGLMGR